MLDRPELVRDVEDRDAELGPELAEERGERLLRLDVDAGGRLVECEQRGLRGERARDERPLLHPARERSQRGVRALGEPDPPDRAADDDPILRPQRAERAADCQSADLDHLAHRDRSAGVELRPLSDVADPRAPAFARCAAEEPDPAGSRSLETEDQPQEGRLAAAVRPGDADEGAGLDRQRDVVENRRPSAIGERDALDLDRGLAGRPRQREGRPARRPSIPGMRITLVFASSRRPVAAGRTAACRRARARRPRAARRSARGSRSGRKR